MSLLPVKAILAKTEHRLWALPRHPWLMRQTWFNLLLVSWAVPLETLRPLIPSRVPIDTFDERAWVSIVAFHIGGNRLHGLPPLPLMYRFGELNLRTYVTVEGKPGIWFFTLDANNPVLVFGGRLAFQLPYRNADIRVDVSGDTVRYSSQRIDPPAPAVFRAVYEPVTPVFHAEPGSLDYFLAERYCLYTMGRGGRLYRGNIHHWRWPLQMATMQVEANTIGAAHGLPDPDASPILHYARQQDTAIWYLEPVQAT